MKRLQTATGNPQRQVKITSDMVVVSVRAGKDGCHELDAKVNLDKLSLDVSAIIKLQVASRHREDIYLMGTVGSPGEIRSKEILEHSSPKYRVYVCLKDESRIIAKSIWMKVKLLEDNEGKVSGILPIEPDNLHGVLWKLEIDRDEGFPILKVNNKPGLSIKLELQNDPNLQAYIIPEVIRQILVSLHNKQDDGYPWVSDWKKWIEDNGFELLGNDNVDDDEINEWAFGISSEFAHSRNMIAKALEPNPEE